jgi:hypothetical protein
MLQTIHDSWTLRATPLTTLIEQPAQSTVKSKHGRRQRLSSQSAKYCLGYSQTGIAKNQGSLSRFPWFLFGFRKHRGGFDFTDFRLGEIPIEGINRNTAFVVLVPAPALHPDWVGSSYVRAVFLIGSVCRRLDDDGTRSTYI